MPAKKAHVIFLSEVQITNALQGSFGNSALEFTQVDPGPVRVVFDNELVSTGGGGGGGCAVPAVGIHTDVVVC
jgi:hypothetical protein